ncbi:MAG: preprotein translocase subunit YajC [Treponema sp.]|nr:MAG: preprotein translocase subunit YajC [Treponema sp.]
MSFISLLQGASGFGSISMLVTMAALFAIFYFLLIRPQKKEQKRMQQMISEAKKGDKIITIGGIHGVISSLKEKSIIIKVDDNCKIEINRSAIGSVVNPKNTTTNTTSEEKAKS